MPLALLALTLAGPPAADRVELTWRGDPTCPSDQFLAALDSHLADVAEAPRPRVTVDVHPTPAGWRLALALTGDDGTSDRALTGASCASVSAAAAFITALVVDPTLLTRAEPPADPPTTVPPPPVATAAPPPPPPEPDLPPPTRPPAKVVKTKSRVRGFVRLAGGLEALGMPGVGPAVLPAAGVHARRWRLELTGLYRAPTRAASSTAPSAGARVRLWSLGARGCGVLRPSVLEIPLCLGVEAGQAIGDGDGLTSARQARLPWFAAVAGPALAWAPRPWLAVWLGLDVAVPLVPGRFTVTGLGEVHRYAPATLRAGLGLEARFP